MLRAMKPFVIRWMTTTVAVFVAAHIVSGISYGNSFGCLLGASLLLGIVNAFIRPVVLLLSLPFILFTLGLGILIVNALMLKLVGSIVPCFQVETFGNAFWGALLISIVSWLLSAFFKDSTGRVQIITHHSQLKQVRGRVIDVD
ncbi:MAG: putative rane protein [Chthoniobacter sp.]|jgi:putative membrane protein|nr:putative rane protein [Chthoniobacter sp.]